MASPNAGGYDQEFLDPPAKLKEFECPLCLLVTREPILTVCCGQHFCQSCINRILTDRKPCPLCKDVNLSGILDKKQKRKVLELKVRCSMKARGCGWTGELGELASHTDMQNGNCRFVDMICPNNCGGRHQRRHLKSHLSDTCPKRPFTCKYCGFESTHEEVCNKHYPECAKFPLPCPNECEVGSVERGEMSEHLSQCPLQLVECEYAHAGCCERIQRKYLAMHMEKNVQKHLLWVFTASQKQIAAMERQMEVMREKNKQLEEKDRQIDMLERRLATLERHTQVLPPVEFTVSKYSQHKRTDTGVDGPVFYTHPRGAKVQARTTSSSSFLGVAKVHMHTIFTSAAYGIVSVDLYQLPGEFDDEIEWPVKCTVTVHLLNQLRDQDHISGSQTFTLTRPTKRTSTGKPDPLKVYCDTIEDRSKRDVQYLKDDCIRFRVSVELN